MTLRGTDIIELFHPLSHHCTEHGSESTVRCRAVGVAASLRPGRVGSDGGRPAIGAVCTGHWNVVPTVWGHRIDFHFSPSLQHVLLGTWPPTPRGAPQVAGFQQENLDGTSDLGPEEPWRV